MNIQIKPVIPGQPLPAALLDKIAQFVASLERDHHGDCVVAVTGHGSSQSVEITSSLTHRRQPQPRPA